MKVIDKFRDDRTLFSFELLPPLRGHDVNSIFETTARLMPYAPAYVNVTYHGEQVHQQVMPDGTFKRRLMRKRAGTVGVAAALMHRYGVDVVPHLVCEGCSPQENENTLIDLSFLGFDNVLALRGDEGSGRVSKYTDAAQLVAQVEQMNRGRYMDYDEGDATDFCIGVAAYPEGHVLNKAAGFDLENLRRKIDNGAHYIVTQMFFDNRHYFRFVEACREFGITVPIVAGLKPFSTVAQLELLPRIFGVELPIELTAEVLRRPEHVRSIGVEWAICQGRELMRAGVPALHFYTMGKADNVEEIVRELF